MLVSRLQCSRMPVPGILPSWALNVFVWMQQTHHVKGSYVSQFWHNFSPASHRRTCKENDSNCTHQLFFLPVCVGPTIDGPQFEQQLQQTCSALHDCHCSIRHDDWVDTIPQLKMTKVTAYLHLPAVKAKDSSDDSLFPLHGC